MEISITVEKGRPFSFLLKTHPIWTSIVAITGIAGLTAAVVMKTILKNK